MLPTNRHALKEWAAVCERLVQGKQILTIRKGGILDAEFASEHREFFLFATHFHEGTPADAATVDLPAYAELVDDIHVTEIDRLRRLEGMHSMSWSEVEQRFRYGKKPGVHVLVLRIFPMRNPTRIPNRPEYAGCVSWVDLGMELPVDTLGPVFNRTDFRQRLEAIQSALGG